MARTLPHNVRRDRIGPSVADACNCDECGCPLDNGDACYTEGFTVDGGFWDWSYVFCSVACQRAHFQRRALREDADACIGAGEGYE